MTTDFSYGRTVDGWKKAAFFLLHYWSMAALSGEKRLVPFLSLFVLLKWVKEDMEDWLSPLVLGRIPQRIPPYAHAQHIPLSVHA